MALLNNHQAFRATTTEALSAAVTLHLGATPVRLPCGPLDAQAENCALPSGSQLWFCDYGQPVTLAFAEGDYVRLQLPDAGSARVTVDGRQITVAPGAACVTSAGTTIEFGAGYRQLVWRVPTDLLARKLSTLTARAVVGRLTFTPDLDLTSGEGRSLEGALLCLARAANDLRGPTARTVLTELEQAVTVALLCAAGHNQRHLLEGGTPPLAPRQVHRVESYIEAHWSEPLGMEDIVAAAGASARSVFRAFAEHRGYSPMQFLKQVRLEQACRLLRRGRPGTTVTDVALQCGYGQMSRFSSDFFNAYGELPSAVLRSALQGQGSAPAAARRTIALGAARP